MKVATLTWDLIIGDGWVASFFLIRTSNPWELFSSIGLVLLVIGMYYLCCPAHPILFSYTCSANSARVIVLGGGGLHPWLKAYITCVPHLQITVISCLSMHFELEPLVRALFISLSRFSYSMNRNGKQMKLEATCLTEAQRCDIITKLSKPNALSK